MNPDRQFPVHSEDRKATPAPHAVPWPWAAQYERRAVLNHSQDLERLASRGGLGWHELLGLVRDVNVGGVLALIRSMSMHEAQKLVLSDVEKWQAGRDGR